MTFNLGEAKLIIDADIDKFIADNAKAYRNIQNISQLLTKVLAAENNLRAEDVKKSLAIILAEQKKAASEAAKAERASIQEQIATRKVLLEANRAAVREQIAERKVLLDANKKAAIEEAKAERERIKEQIAARKEYFAANKRAVAEEEAAAKQAAQARAQAEKDAQNLLKQIRKENDAEEAKALQQRNNRAKAIRDYEATLEKERLAQVAKTVREEAIIRSNANKKRVEEAKAAALAEQRANAQSRGGLTSLLPSIGNVGNTAATLLGFGAIASTAVIVRQAIVNTNEAILKTEQSLKALNAGFGNASPIFKKYADDNAEAFNRVSSDVEKGTAYFGILQKQYGITGAEIKRLIPIAIELQKQFGGDLGQVFKDVSNAIQGETQALEKYGIALQSNAIRNNDLLTESEQRLYEKMSITEQGRIRIRVLEAEAIKRRSQEATGLDKLTEAHHKFERANDELFKSLGQGVKNQGVGFLNWLSGVLNAFTEINNQRNATAQAIREINAERKAAGQNEIGKFLTSADKAAIQERLDRGTKAEQDKAGIAIIEDYRRTREGLEKVERDARETRLKQEQEALELQVRAAHDAEIRRLDDEIDAANARKVAQLDKLEAEYKAEKKNAENIEYIRQQASELELARITKERDNYLRAAEDKRDEELERLRVAHEATKNASEEQIRLLQIEQEHRKKANEKQHEDKLQQLDQDKIALDRARKEEDYLIDQSITKQKRRLDRAHKDKVEQLDKEKLKAQESYNSQIKKIDDLIYKEDERHRKRNQHIEDELKKAKKAIDDQIEGIEAVAQARENAQRRSELTTKVSEAENELRLAKGTGTPEQVAAANQKLVGAIRIGDPVAIKKAQEELVEISGKGNAAILEAQKKLTAAQQELTNQGLEEAEAAEKKRLENKKDSLDEEADKLKRKEDDDNRRRKRSLDLDKQAEKEKLDDFNKKLDERKKKEEKHYEDLKQRLEDSIDFAKKQRDENRKNEDIALEASRKAEEKRYKNEQDAIDETYNSEEKGLIPAIRRAQRDTDEKYAAMERATRKRYDDEQEKIHETYDDPVNGLIAVHKRVEEAARRQYALTTAEAAATYESARQQIERAFNAPDKKSGIIDQFNVMKDAADTKLKEVNLAFQEASKGLIGDQGVIKLQWAEAIRLSNEYFDNIKARSTEKVSAALRADEDVDAPSSRRGSGAYTNSGVNSSGRGTGSTTSPSSSGSSGPQIPNTTVANEVDMSPDRYIKRLGFGEKYNGTYVAGAGWEADGNTAAWPNGPTRHKGQDLILRGDRNGYGQPVGAFQSGTVISTHGYTGNPYKDPGGSYVVIEDSSGKTHWYMHLAKIHTSTGKSVSRGTVIGTLGDTGTEDINYPHLHYEVRNGFNDGPKSIRELMQNGIDPNPYIRARDSGYRFTNPTLAYDMRTGNKSIIAEKGPERLLGRVATQQMESMGLRRALSTAYSSTAASLNTDYSAMGAALSSMPIASVSNNREGDVFNYNGFSMQDVFKKFREDQRRQRVLRGA